MATNRPLRFSHPVVIDTPTTVSFTKKTLAVLISACIGCGGTFGTMLGAVGVALMAWTSEPSQGPEPPKKPSGGEVDVTTMPHFAKIRSARKKIAPIPVEMVEPVRELYNKEFTTRAKWARDCLEKAADFDRVERKTLYPRALILGKALHESMGCNMIAATNGDGGQGYNQVTTPEDEQMSEAASMLGLKRVRDLKWKSIPDHHLVLATIMFSDCEKYFGRRDLGLLCYNMGRTGVENVAKKIGWSEGKKYPTLPKLLPHIWSKPKKGILPNIYVQRVLAGAVMMKKVLEGKELRKLAKGELTLDDIPGARPDQDGNQFRTKEPTIADDG